MFMRKSKYEQYLEEYKMSGMSMKGFCEEKQINYGSFNSMYLSRERQNAEVEKSDPMNKFGAYPLKSAPYLPEKCITRSV